MVARAVQHGHDSSVEAVLLEGEEEFSLDPFRCDGIGGQDQGKSVAAPQGGSDFVVPLLRAPNAGVAVPERDAVALEYIGEPSPKRAVRTRVRQEDFVRHGF